MQETLDHVAETLGGILRDESETLLTRDLAARIDAAAAAIATDPAAARRVLDRLHAASRIIAHETRTPSLYAAGVLEAMAGGSAASHDAFLHLVSALERAGEWDGFIAASARALALIGESEHGPEYARCLARAWEKGGPGAIGAALLLDAERFAASDPRVLWALGFALAREGRRAEGDPRVAASLAGFVHKAELARVEEGFLHLLETEDPGVADALLETLFLLTRSMGGDVAAPYWELASGYLDARGLQARAWTFFKEHLVKHPDQEALRPAAFRAFRGMALPRGIAEDSLESTGLLSALRPLPEAIPRTDLLLGWPPGLYVDHKYSGIGRVIGNNCDMLRIEFPRGPQELSLEIAGRSLLKLDPADLRVRIVWDREGLARQATSDPAGLVHAALVSLRGEGSLPDLKRVLIPNAVSVEAWTDFWKRASKAMKDDPRFDLSQSVRKIYRAVDPSARPPALVPKFDVKEGLAKRVDTLEKFLDEAEGRQEIVREAHGASLVRLYGKEALDSPARLAGALLLLRLGLIDDDAARSAVAAFFAGAEEFPSLVGKGVQARCLALATGMEDPTPVYLAALAARTGVLRDEAISLLAAHYAEGYLKFLLALLVKSPVRTPAILHIVRQREFVSGWPAWDALLALVRIIASRQREAHEKAAFAALMENEALRGGLRDHDPVPETWETLRMELASWRASERLLIPILEVLDGVGRSEFAEDVREARKGGTRKEGARAAVHLTSFVGRTIMTRAAYERLSDEVKRVGMELKTTIPKAIETARAHGDLRENAEYEAAKEKQRRFAARLTELEEKWNRALILEPSMVAAGVVGPGTEITIEAVDGGERETYWILGEGDDLHGEHVISYLAPLGKAFAGRRVGDEAPVSVGGRERRYRVVSVEMKLPG